jgi:ribosomal protein S18 acetylase RimI-like enzyme
MGDATGFGTQWAGIVALVRIQGRHAPDATLIEEDGMVASILPVAPASSLMNTALTVDHSDAPRGLAKLAERFRDSGAQKWGLWLDGENTTGAKAAQEQGMVLDSRPAPMVATLADVDDLDDPPERNAVDLATVGKINDLAYVSTAPKLAPAIAAFPNSVLTYADPTKSSVALAYDVGDDTAVWFVATLPQAQGQGLAGNVLERLLRDARERGQFTASLQASPAGRPLYERLGFRTVGTLHLYEQRFVEPT